MKKTMMMAMAVLGVFAASAELILDEELTFDRDISVTNGELKVIDGAKITAVSHTFANVVGYTTHLTMLGGQLIATADYGKLEMPCDDVRYAFCLGNGAGYVVAEMGGGEIICTNGLFTVSKEAYTTCMVTGTVIRCRGFRLRTGEQSGYATFILGEGGRLEVGDWGLRSFHDPDVVAQYEVGNKDFLYYIEMRGGKIKFTDSFYNKGYAGGNTLEHSPCLIMAPDTDSEIEVPAGKTVYYAGQLQGAGTLHKTGGGTLILASAFIKNEGTIVIDEGIIQTFSVQDNSRFYGDVIIKDGAMFKVELRGGEDPNQAIKICREGNVYVEEGGKVLVKPHNGDWIDVDFSDNTTNGGYIESRERYRVGVNMNLGSYNWSWGEILPTDENVGALAESGDTWGMTREYNNYSAQTGSDVMLIYCRSDLSRSIKFSYWAHNYATNACPTAAMTGNMHLTKCYLDDCADKSQNRDTGGKTAVNYLNTKETNDLPEAPCPRAWQMRLEDLPYAEYDIYLIFACHDTDVTTSFAPVNLKLTSPDGKQSSPWTSYSFGDIGGGVMRTKRSSDNWAVGTAQAWVEGTSMNEGVNYLKIHMTTMEASAIGVDLDDLSGTTIDITPGPVSKDGSAQVRSCLAGFQIVPTGEPMPELDINEYTAFEANKNIYNLTEGESFTANFQATNETMAIGFVHAISNTVHIAPHTEVNGREFPTLPGENCRFTFNGANSENIKLDVMYLPWMDNQTNELTTAQLDWVTNRWGGAIETTSVSNRTLNTATAIAGADSDGDKYRFLEEWAMNSDLTAESNPTRLCIVGREIRDGKLYLDVEYTRTENGVVLSNNNAAVSGWMGVTNGMSNAAWLQLALKGGKTFGTAGEGLAPIALSERGDNEDFTASVRNRIAIPLDEITNRFFRATMEVKGSN